MKKQDYFKILILCGLLYMFCLLQFLGISLGRIGDGQKTGMKGTTKETIEHKTSSMEGEAPRIAITFDDGPSAHCTGRLLDGLKERGIKGTFFLIGKNAEENPELVKRLYEEGHLIGNHTYSHVEITKLSDEDAKKEIMETDRVISSITGEHVEYMRPPFGLWQDRKSVV